MGGKNLHVMSYNSDLMFFCGSTKPIPIWLGRRFLFKTFVDDVEISVDEVRQLLDLSDDNGEDELYDHRSER